MSGKAAATTTTAPTPATQEPVAKSPNEAKPLTPTQEKRVFDETTTSVRINDDEDGEEFTCDEEPHMLGPELGYGYFPVALGQFIHGGKLEIVRKLGWATSSSVWLACTHDESYPTKYVAVKILTVNNSAGVFDGQILEPDILKHIAEHKNSKHPGVNHCLRYYDLFLENSVHGPHVCITTEVLSGSLIDLRRALEFENGSFPVVLTKMIVKQKLLGLDFLHRVCGLVHTDVKPDNTLLRIPNVDAVIDETLEEEPSTTYPPRIEPDLSPDPIITVLSQPIPFTEDSVDPKKMEACLMDFGESLFIGKRERGMVQPVQLRAPEVILGYPWAEPIDIWAIGCLVFEYLTGAALFQLYETDNISIEDVHLRRITELTGQEFPKTFLEKCGRRDSFFDSKTGKLLRMDEFESHPLENVLSQSGTMRAADVGPAAAFIRKCLEIDPEKRPTAEALLKDEWLADI